VSEWEGKFREWAKPPSATEAEKIENAERAIRKAISNSDKLNSKDIRIIVQGSYKNNVNVRQESDVDIGIVCSNTFYHGDLPPPLTRESLGIRDATYRYDEYWNDVLDALVDHFGREAVAAGGKAFDIKSNTYRVQADVAAFFEHRRYDVSGRYISGVEMRPQKYPDGIVNWPDQHYENGVEKNNNTQRRYKSLVRIVKKLMYEMQAEGIQSAINSPGFLIECLVWNVPNNLMGKASIYDDVRDCLIHLYQNTKDDESCREWGEVSELKYLFRRSQPWDRPTTHQFVIDAWNYVGFE
jgi:predicted nucleotidyltransferase